MMAENFLFYFFSSIALISGVMVIRSKNPVHSVLFLILVFCNAAGLLILLHLDFFAMIFLVVYVGAIAVLFLFVVMMLHIKLTEMNENILRYLPVGGIIGLIFLFEVLLVVENELIPLFVDEQVGISIQNGGYFDFESLNGLSISDAKHSIDRIADGLVASHSNHSTHDLSIPQSIHRIDSIASQTHDLFSESVVGFAKQSNQSMQSILGSIIWDFQSFQYIQWPLKIENVTNIEALGQILYTYYFYFFILASLILLIAMIGAIVLTHRTKSNSFGLVAESTDGYGVSISSIYPNHSNHLDSHRWFLREEVSIIPFNSTSKHQKVFEQNTREFSKTIKKLRF